MDFLKISDKTTTTPCRTDSFFGLHQQKDMDFHHLIAPHAGNGVLGCYYYYPFTNEQLKELERQAMIYKYMIASIPVPFDLLVSSSPSPIKNVNGDLEPGRCRRTDGKKWRCSREVVSNHKYCERHLHRGRPRSRKLVEQPYSRNNGGSDKITPKKVSSLLESRGSKIFPVPAPTKTEEDNKYLNFIDVWSDQLRGSEKQSSSSSPVSSVNGNLSLYSLDLSMGGNNYDEMSRIQMGENPVYSSYGTLGGPLAEILRPNPYLDFSSLQSTADPLFTNGGGDRESCSLATTLTRSSSPSRAMKKKNGSVSDENSHV